MNSQPGLGRICLTFLFGAIVATAATAQDFTITDEPEDDAEADFPPTIVEGVLDPAAPLSADVAITPTRTNANIAAVGSSTTVITEQQIEQTGSFSVANVLRQAVGIDVVQTGPVGGLTTVFMRGANGQHTKVLMDGIPVNDPSSAARAFDFSTLAVDNIERIEVVRGPQSTLYGSDAIGGVINIITKKGEGPMSIRANAFGGAYGTNRDYLQISGGDQWVNYSAAGSFNYTDGFSAASERLGNVEDDAFRLGTANGRFGLTPADAIDIDFIFRWSDARAEIDDAAFSIGAPPTDDLTRLNLTQTFFSKAQARWDSLDGGVEQRVAIMLTDYQRRDTDDFFPASFEGQTRKAEYQANLLLTDTNLFTFGANHVDESAANSFGTDAAQFNSSVYIQDQFQLGERLSNTIGFRWDDYNVAGAAETYQFRSVFDIYETNTSLHGTLGTGFRAPSLAENLAPFGNANLRPERSRGWDLGVTQYMLDNTLRIETNYFRNDFTDLILFNPNVAPFGQLENIGKARSHGVEVIAAWQIRPDTNVFANYTRTDTVGDDGAPLPRRPRDKGTVGLTYNYDCNRAEVTLYANLVGPRFDSNNGTNELAGYTLLNLAGHYEINDCWQFYYRFDNLLNQHYEIVTGYATPAFSAFGGLGFRL